jgi:ribosomal protein S18 acetylase RimI-like enzyme
MRIEPADVGDADILADLWVDLTDEQKAFSTHIQAEANRSRIREDLVRRIITGEVLVARGDVDGSGNVAGFVSFGLETKRYDHDVQRGVVYNLYVRPEYRNEGVGRELLTEAERRLAENGVDLVSLQAMAENDAARRFYERLGYQPHRVELEKRIDDDRAEPTPEDESVETGTDPGDSSDASAESTEHGDG